MDAAAIGTMPLCGDCATAVGAKLVPGSLEYGTPCDSGRHGEGAVAATGRYLPAGLMPAAPPAPASTRPRLELVESSPPALEHATRVAFALQLLIGWTHGKGAEGAAECDAFLVERAVEAVERIHRTVHKKGGR